MTAALLFSRLPSLFVHAQFYAEDGTVWYAEAYRLGWLHSLALPDGGYLNTLQRLGAGLSMLLPFRWTPLGMAIFGLLIQCLPVAVLLSSRCRRWAPLSTRALFALVYVASANAREVHVVLTNCHWHLVLAVFLLAFGSAPAGWRGRLLDAVLFSIAGVSGPFALLLLPFLFLFWWLRRQPWSLVQAAITAVGAMVQAFFLTHGSNRIEAPLGAGVGLLIRIFGGNVILAGTIGSRVFSSRHFHLRNSPEVFFVLMCLVSVILYAHVLRSAAVEMKLFTVVCLCLFALSMKSPLIDASPTRWLNLMIDPGCRYWFFPMLAFLWGVVLCVRNAPRGAVRSMAVVLVCLMPIGIVTDWKYDAYPDFDFPAYAERMRVAKPGTQISTPIPPGKNVILTLTKKAE